MYVVCRAGVILLHILGKQRRKPKIWKKNYACSAGYPYGATRVIGLTNSCNRNQPR